MRPLLTRSVHFSEAPLRRLTWPHLVTSSSPLCDPHLCVAARWRAQTSPPLVPAAPPPQDAPLLEPREDPPGQLGTPLAYSRMHGVPRVSLELVSGSVGTLAGAFLGLVASISIGGEPWCLNLSDDDCEASTAFRGAIPMLLFTSGGAALGVYGVGTYLGDGAGRFLPTLGGAALASIGSLVIYTVAPPGDGSIPLYLGALLLPSLGALLGYELSHAWVDAHATPRSAVHADAGFRLVPVVARSPGGGLLGGLAGRF